MDTGEALTQAPIFRALKQGQLKSLERTAKMRQFARGELLVREGEDAVAFYVVCSGQAEVVKALGRKKEQVVGHLGPGDFFGEMALLDGFPRSASVRAATDCECLALIRWDFLGVVRSRIEVALGILPVLSRRLRECEDQLLP